MVTKGAAWSSSGRRGSSSTTMKALKKPQQASKKMRVAASKQRRLTAVGQHFVKSEACISTTPKDGSPCPFPRVEPHLPYCKACLRGGDPALKKVKHPKYGHCLIAQRALKKGYQVAWWGRRISAKKLPSKSWDWALMTPRGIVDAVPFRTGSLLQFCQCPGPTEVPTIDFSQNRDELLASKPKTCRLFATLCDIPKGHQVTMTYSNDEKAMNEFFAERGIVRADVGCKEFPAMKRKKRTAMRKS